MKHFQRDGWIHRLLLSVFCGCDISDWVFGIRFEWNKFEGEAYASIGLGPLYLGYSAVMTEDA